MSCIQVTVSTTISRVRIAYMQTASPDFAYIYDSESHCERVGSRYGQTESGVSYVSYLGST